MDRTPPPDAAERELVYPGGTHVLIIGISAYANGAWPNLHASRDVERVQRLFLDRGVSATAITVVAPTTNDRMSIDETIVRFGESLPADTAGALRVVIYFAGHGYTRDGVGYLVPPAAPDPETHPADFKTAALPISTILARIAAIRAAHVLLIMDSCFSGIALQSLPHERFPHPADHAHVLQVITAGTATQTVADDGHFSQLLVSGLLGAADLNLDGWVSGTELGMYLRLRMSELTGGRQTPTFGNVVWGSELSQGENWFASGQLVLHARDRPQGDGREEKTAFRDCDECPPMRVVPTAAGIAASTALQPYLAMATHETTFEEYDACFRAGRCMHWARSNSSSRGALPVTDVSRGDAEQYARWLTCRGSGHYRLPRDEEWLAAAQSDVGRLAAGAPTANCRDCAKGPPSPAPTPAGSFAANDYGLFDLAGNVWEWTADCVPLKSDCRQGKVRGGAYTTVRSAVARLPADELPESTRDINIGFRVVRDISANYTTTEQNCAAEEGMVN